MFDIERSSIPGPEEVRDEMTRLAGKNALESVEEVISPEPNTEEALTADENGAGDQAAEVEDEDVPNAVDNPHPFRG